LAGFPRSQLRANYSSRSDDPDLDCYIPEGGGLDLIPPVVFVLFSPHPLTPKDPPIFFFQFGHLPRDGIEIGNPFYTFKLAA